MSTWRHTFYGQCLILLIAGCAYGQWDTNAWPAYEHPRAGKIHAENCYSAVVERCDAVNVSLPSAPSWYRSQRGNLVAQKAKLKALTTSYIHPKIVTNGSIIGWLNGFTNRPYSTTWSPNYTLGTNDYSFYAQCSLPTNFFDYTPYRGLDGIGPFTNDVTVGHAHGWTNEYTAAGGTNFPYGRTNWYTTDYGWSELRTAVTNLTATVAINRTDTYKAQMSGDSDYGETNAAVAKAQAISNFYASATNTTPPNFITIVIASLEWFYQIRAVSNVFLVSSVCKTNITPSVKEVYFVSETTYYSSKPENYSGGSYGYTNQGAWFNSYTGSVNYLEYGWQNNGQDVSDFSSGLRKYGYGIGSLDLPPFPDDPVTGSAELGYSVKYNVGAQAALFLDFAGGVYGFKYK